MDRAKPVTAVPQTLVETPSAPPMELLHQATSQAALSALETALAAAHAEGKRAEIAAHAKACADEAVRAAADMRGQLSALETLARMAALVDAGTPPAKGR
jgi:hypothetical protein